MADPTNPTNPTNPSSNTGRASAEDVRNQSEFYELLVKSTKKEEELLRIQNERSEALGLQSDLYEAELNYQNKILLNLQQNGDVLRDARVTAKEINDAKKQQKQLNEEILELERTIGETKGNEYQTIDDLTKKEREQLKLKKEQLEEINKIAEAEEMSLKTLLEKAGLEEEVINMKLEGEKTLLDLLKDNLDDEQKRKDLLEKARGINENILNVNKKVSGISTKIATSVGLASDSSDTFLGGMVDIMTSSAAIGKNMNLMSLVSKNLFGQSLNIKNVFFSIVDETLKIANNIEKASKELGKATGFGNAFNETLRDTASSLTLMGGDEQSAKTAIQELANSFSAFHPAAHEANVLLATTTSRLSMIGVSATSSVKMMDYFNKTMGMTVEESANVTAQIAMMGKEMGVTASKMASDFQNASSRLTIYGNDNIKVFKGLAAQAKATGLAVSELINISKGYDKFDTAAEKVGQLNAVLGTNLNTLEMINATDSERIDIIRTQVKASVGNIDGLDKYTKMHIAAAMGLDDVDKAQRLLNMSQSEYLKNVNKQKESADVQKELAQMTAELVPAMQKLGLVMMKVFRIFTPFINGFLMIGEAIDFVYGYIVQFTEYLSGSGAGSGLITVLKYVGVAIGLLTLPISGTAAAIASFVAALGALYDIFHKPGSLSMAEGMFDKTIGPSLASMGEDALKAKSDLNDLNSEMEKTYEAAHPGGKSMDIQAAAKIDTNAIATGITKVKSALKELSSVQMVGGFLAMKTDGSSTSLIMADDTILSSVSEGKLTVDVNMPEIKMPEMKVVVEVDDIMLKKLIDARIDERGVRT